MSENALLVPNVLKSNVDEWNTLVSYIEKNKHKLRPKEDTTFYTLRDHGWSGNYKDIDYIAYINAFTEHLTFHDNDFKNAINEFKGICRKYYKTEELLEAFQKANGGKKSKKQEKQDTTPKYFEKQFKEQPKPKPNPDSKQEEKIRLKPNDPKTLYYTDGYYTGEIKDGEPNGRGKRYFTVGESKGSFVEGIFLNGKLNDKNGKIYYSEYERLDLGEYRNGIRCGKGKMEWDNGSWYEGGWNDNGRHGYGTTYDSFSKLTSIGDFKDNYRKGKGVLKWNDGDWYEGTWDDTKGDLKGKGIFYDADGGTAKGRWVNGKFVRNKINPRDVMSLGAKIWSLIPYLPWVLFAIIVIQTFFSETIGNVIITIIVGAILAFVAQLLIAWVLRQLEAVRNGFLSLPKWLRIIIWILVLGLLGKFAWSKFEVNRFFKQPVNQVQTSIQSFLIGTWNGTLNNNKVKLEITSVKDNTVEATIYLPEKTKKLKGSIKGETLQLNNEVVNGYYDGYFTGSVNNNLYEGKYTNPKTNKTVSFKFQKQ